jgi:hypothetical protein
MGLFPLRLPALTSPEGLLRQENPIGTGRVPVAHPVLSIPLTNLQVSRQPQLCHPERAPDFPATLRQPMPRVRLSVKKAA